MEVGDMEFKKTKTICLEEKRSLQFGPTLIMGILNVNDDSFYDASRTKSPDAAINRASEMIEAGADILDIGAESTRPGSLGLDAEREAQALIPVVESVRATFPSAIISVDTRKASVATACVEAGADIVNDVSGLELDAEKYEMAELIASRNVGYVLMHTKGTPETMRSLADYRDFWSELMMFFEEKISWLAERGVSRNKIILDPGIGFAKRMEDNLTILANMRELKKFGLPILIGASRKGFIGRLAAGARDVSPLPPTDRLPGTLAVTSLCASEGIDIVRVHDVAENIAVVRTIKEIERYSHV